MKTKKWIHATESGFMWTDIKHQASNEELNREIAMQTAKQVNQILEGFMIESYGEEAADLICKAMNEGEQLQCEIDELRARIIELTPEPKIEITESELREAAENLGWFSSSINHLARELFKEANNEN